MGLAETANWLRFLALAAIAGALLALPATAPAAQGGFYTVGDNRMGELGNASDNKKEVAHSTPFGVAIFGAPGYVVSIAAGPHTSFAMTSFGQLYGFGENYFGQLGSSTNNGVAVEEFSAPNPNPSQILLPGSIGDVVEVAAGRDHTLALTSTGQVFSFGNNLYGQLGTATNAGVSAANPAPAKVALPGATGPAAQISAGWNSSLVVTTTGQLYAFGNNASGQLGTFTNSGTGKPNSTPALVTLPGATGPVVQASAAPFHSLAVTSTGQLFSFGSNADGQLGRPLNAGTANPNPLPEEVTLPGATGPVVQACAGPSHSFALTATGQLYAFGYNFYGQLGVATFAGTSTRIPVPQLVSLPGATGPVVRTAASVYNGYAITSTGQLFSFGSNRWGQLATSSGVGTLTNQPKLVAVAGERQIEDVAAGDEHTLLLTGDLSVTTDSIPSGASGSGYSAQLGSAGGTAPRRWSAAGLPSGLAIDANGVISGTPTEGGSFNPTVTVTDRYGIAASKTFALAISGGSGGGAGGAGGAPAPQAATAPRLVGLVAPRQSISLEGRLVGGKCVPVSSANRAKPSCRQKLDLPLGVKLDSAAKVTVEIERLSPGRLRRGRCLEPSDANRKLPSCTRSIPVGKPIVEQAGAGSDTISIDGPALAPGRYEVTATPSANGRTGTPRTTTITISG